MGKCGNEKILDMIGISKLDDQSKIILSVLTDTDNCMKIKADKPIRTTAETSAWDRYTSPPDMFNCLAEGCKNSGTLTLSGTIGTAVGAEFLAQYDATEFAAGLMTYYLYFPNTGTYTVASAMRNATEDTPINTDVYNQTVTVTEAGWRPIVVDFSIAPTSTTGTGWIASARGAIVSVTVENAEITANTVVGISSFYFYNSIEEFITNAVVKIGCLTEVARSLTVDALETQCAAGGYDATTAAIEYTVTGNTVTPNYYLLNPLMQKTDKTKGWVPAETIRTIESTTVNGVEYGYVQVLNMFTEECGFISASIADQCNITDAQLDRVYSPVVIALDERQFIALDGVLTGSADAGKFLFNKALIGKRVNLTYPAQADIKASFDITDENVNGRKVRAAIVICQSDKVKQIDTLNNVLVTSFPGTINREETAFAFTLSIRKDASGKFGTSNVIDD